MGLSIRLTLTGLITLCIALTAFVCMYMTITSGDSALENVKDVRDSSVKGLFNVSEVNLRKTGKALTEKISEGAVEKVTGFFQQYQDMIIENLRLIEAPDGQPFASGSDYFRKMWGLRTTFALQVDRYKSQGVTTVGTSWRPSAWVELIVTPLNSSDISLKYNDGLQIDYQFRRGITKDTIGLVEHIPTTNQTSLEACPPLTQAYAYNNTPCLQTNTPESEVINVMSITPPGEDNVVWLRIYAGVGYMITVVIGTWRNEHGVKSGTIYSAIGISRVSEFLSKVDMGTPRGRVFTAIRSDWTGFGQEQLGWLTGVSHGRAEWWFDDVAHPHYNPSGGRQAYWATDDVIRTAGEWVRDHNSTTTVSGYEALLQGGDIVEVSLNTSQSGNESFYLSVGQLKPGRGFDWYIVTLIDREFIMGEIDRALVTIRDEIDESSQKADDDLDTARLILYVTVAVIVVCLVAASVALVYFITYPLLVLQVEMGYVAVMKLEDVDVDRAPSFLQEVGHMQWSFLQMIRNIKEYRNYMPASVLLDETDDDEGSESSRNKSSEGHSGSTRTSLSKKGVAAAASKLQLGNLATKDTGVMVVNKRGSLRDRDLAASLEQYLEAVVGACTNHRGIPESFYGDTVYMTWNAVRPVSQYYVQMCKCALLLKANVSQPSIGMVSQRMKVGNMGCSNMRKFSYMGYGFPAAVLVEKLNKVYKSQVLGASLNDGVAQNFMTKIVDKVLLPKLSEQKIMLLEIMEEKTVSDEEWMYQLEHGEARDPYTLYNRAATLYLAEDYVKAEQVLRPMLAGNETKQLLNMYQRIVEGKEGRHVPIDSISFRDF